MFFSFYFKFSRLYSYMLPSHIPLPASATSLKLGKNYPKKLNIALPHFRSYLMEMPWTTQKPKKKRRHPHAVLIQEMEKICDDLPDLLDGFPLCIRIPATMKLRVRPINPVICIFFYLIACKFWPNNCKCNFFKCR